MRGAPVESGSGGVAIKPGWALKRGKKLAAGGGGGGG